MRHWTLAALLCFLALLPGLAEARVTRFVVQQVRPFADGTAFGDVGPYQRLDGMAYFEVDPRDPLNAVIVDLDKAPRNARGLVEFSSPFYVLMPAVPARGNGKILYTINNRGNKISIGRFNYAVESNDPLTVADAGDGFLMRLGYTIVDAGWQGDVAPGGGRLVPELPIVTLPDGSPIVGPVRIEYSDRTIPRAGTFSLPLEGSSLFQSYPSADMNPAHALLTVRDTVDGPKTPVAADRWAFGSCPTGAASLVPSATRICLFDGFRADRLYELTYAARDPKVMGLGYAVTRDLGSFLRYRTHDDAGNPNPLAGSVRRSYAVGFSSTGMYLRDWLYLGFNEDEGHRRVFDAVWAHTPGTHRLLANTRFADPNTYSRQDDRHDFLSTSMAPLTWGLTTDPVSGVRDGILKRPATDPLVVQTMTETEFWQFRASLEVADGSGRPIEPPRNVRLYYLSSFDHAAALPSRFPSPPGICRHPVNAQYHGPTLRAVLVALDAWADQGVRPPASEYPGVRSHTLVTLDEARAAFPDIPGVAFPTVLNELQGLDFGPTFDARGGVPTIQPPLRGPGYRILVPKPDRDGLSIAGVRPLQIRVPLGTHTGWNLRAPGFREPNLCGLMGSFIPFETTKAQRRASGDPRKSLQERYRTHAGYVHAVERAARQLVRERFLLEEDAERFVREAQASSVLR